ncbi:MAG: hypothetical protein HC765_01750 [Brachymonas sp.]|nr:hypothetical protein [Brachymonas sp.]
MKGQPIPTAGQLSIKGWVLPDVQSSDSCCQVVLAVDTMQHRWRNISNHSIVIFKKEVGEHEPKQCPYDMDVFDLWMDL